MPRGGAGVVVCERWLIRSVDSIDGREFVDHHFDRRLIYFHQDARARKLSYIFALGL